MRSLSGVGCDWAGIARRASHGSCLSTRVVRRSSTSSVQQSTSTLAESFAEVRQVENEIVLRHEFFRGVIGSLFSHVPVGILIRVRAEHLVVGRVCPHVYLCPVTLEVELHEPQPTVAQSNAAVFHAGALRNLGATLVVGQDL